MTHTTSYLTPRPGSCRRRTFACVLLAAALTPVGLARANPKECRQLKGSDKSMAKQVFSDLKGYGCCTKSLAECLRKAPRCVNTERAAADLCQRIASGDTSVEVREAYQSRMATMSAQTKRYTFDTKGAPIAGNAEAPVTLVEYACATCPACGRVTPELYQAVTTGPLKGKAKLVFRPFPLRNHEHSKEANLGFVAAQKLGKFWPFMTKYYSDMEGFDAAKQRRQARAVGIDLNAFEKAFNDPNTLRRLVASKKEGIRNRVEATPTVYLNGRKVVTDYSIDTLVDLVEEAVESAAAR